MIQTNEDLFEFLYQWHRARPGELCLPETAIPNGLPGVLQRAYAAIGLLTRRRSPFNPGNQNGCPLGTQDCLFEPEQLKIEDGLVRFVTENQGCWDCYVSVSEDDPEVFSTALHSLGRSETKLTPIGSKLSDFLITFCLQETVMSGLTKHAIMLSDDDERYQKISTEPIWLNANWVFGETDRQFHVDLGGELMTMNISNGEMVFHAFRQLAGQPVPPRTVRYELTSDRGLRLSSYVCDERDLAKKPFGFRHRN